MLEEELYGNNSPIWDPDFTHNPASIPVSPPPPGEESKPTTRGKTAAAAAATASSEEAVSMSPRRSGKTPEKGENFLLYVVVIQ